MLPPLAWSFASLVSLFVVIGLPSCQPPEPARPDDGRALPARESVPDHANQGGDAILKETMSYRYATRMAYNSSRFDELEHRADEARNSREKFANGSWKIAHFYESLACDEREPESMWELHDRIHRAWVAAKPDSITAKVAQTSFLVEYAWHARGDGFAPAVTPIGWKLFGERLTAARQILDETRKAGKKCPGWWLAGMRIALGQNWPREEYERFYAEAKAFEPTFWYFDTRYCNHLSTKWYGYEGEWEEAAARAAADPQGLGAEIYARCVFTQYANYKNVFAEANASWPKTQEGLELMQSRYPGSLEVTSGYCRLACIAGDRATARRLFDELGDHVFSYLWLNLENLRRDRAWAHQEG